MDNNNMNMKQTLQLLGIQEVTTKRQKKNGAEAMNVGISISQTMFALQIYKMNQQVETKRETNWAQSF